MKKLKLNKFNFRKISAKNGLLFFGTLFFFVLVLTTFYRSYGEFVSNVQRHASGVDGTVVYINDAESDYYHYMGLNYTYSDNGALPSKENKNVYNSNNLVEMTITYDGADNVSTNLVGKVSTTENQNKYVYYKVMPVNNNGTTSKSDDYVYLELIDNPFANRPSDLGFNGWVTNYRGVKILLNTERYIRYATIPVTYTGDKPNLIEITFNAKWITSNLVRMSQVNSSGGYGSNANYWTNSFRQLSSDGFVSIGQDNVYPVYEDMSPYYEEVYYNSGSENGVYPPGSYDNRLNDMSGQPCPWYCQFYRRAESEYHQGTNYYEYRNRTMQYHNPIIDHYDGDPGVPIGSNIAGYYKEYRASNRETVNNIYTSDGKFNSSITCRSSGGCTYYELQNYYKDDNTENVAIRKRELYYKVTRDTNIIVFDRNVSNVWSTTKPVTITGIYNGTKYNYTLTISGTNITTYTDTRIEYITISSGTSASNSEATVSTNRRYIYGNYHNLKIGRGITHTGTNTNARAVFGAGSSTSSQGSSTSPKRFRLIVESGYYDYISASLGTLSAYSSSRPSIYINSEVIVGNDYDRVVTANNGNLEVYENLNGTFGGKYYQDSNGDYLFDVTLKSGAIGTSENEYSTGVYVGGYGYSYEVLSGLCKFTMEGGNVFNIVGGPLVDDDYQNKNPINIYVKGGTIDTIFGGAGRSTSYGNRIVQVTGGKVNYSVFGGSNGNITSGNNATGAEDGKINGTSYVYIGGKAVIGDETLVTNNTINSYEYEAGSVFGNGNGKTGYDKIGSCDNSIVIIDENAHILRNVYGGGNYGATGASSSSNTTTTNIKVINGTIDGSIYGGGNNNGSGLSSKTSTVTIDVLDGTIKGSVYGGSKALGTVYGSTNINVLGGTITNNVYGGGEGGYTDSTDKGTFVTGTVNIKIGDNSVSTTPTIAKVYGGSAYGTVNGSSNGTSISLSGTTVTVNKGNITSVFGGGEGNNTFTPYVLGNITVNINNGTITNVFGGNDAAGTPNGTITVNVNNGTITNTYGGGNYAAIKTSTVNLNGGTSTNVYGGGNYANATTTNIYLQGSNTTSVYGGSNQSGTVTTSNITATSGSATTIYGGNNLGGTTTTANVSFNGGTAPTIYGGGNEAVTGTTTVTIGGGNTTTVYGGGNKASTGTTNVNLNASTITNVYGGGNEAGVTNSTHVTLNGSTVTSLFGGSNSSGDVEKSYVISTRGSATTIYGGNNLGGKTKESDITINGGTIGTVYGGGNEATTDTTLVKLNGSTITNVYGGGNKAGVTNSTTVNQIGSTVTNLYGGSNQSGDVPVSNITTTGGTTTTIYGGNNSGGSTDVTNITANGGNITTIYGGGNEAESTTSNIKIKNLSSACSNIYGGGNKASVTTTNVDIEKGVTIGTIYGGSNQSGTVTTSNIHVLNVTPAPNITDIYGGNNAGGTTTSANINIESGSIVNVYGGGNNATTGSTNTSITNASVVGQVFGGGNNAGVTGDAVLSINSSTINGNVYGGGNLGTIGNDTTVTVSNSTLRSNIFAGGNGTTATVTGGTNLTVKTRSNITGNVYGGGNNAASGSTNTTIQDATVTGQVFGGGNNASVAEDASLKIYRSTINGNVYGGGNLGTIGTDTYVLVSVSNLGNNLFAGGNGATAIVHGNTTLDVEGNTTVARNVFGGGNAAATGTSESNSSTSVVNIAGLTCGGNVYGGANTSVLYGIANVNIGSNVVSNNDLTRGNIHISGTVFGGGEANASGSEIYDFNFISVTTGINININGSGHSTFDIDGSIFGSGNASSTSGYSYVTIKNYGNDNNVKRNVSIQRANIVTIDNSAILLTGATDRTNEYSDVLFSLSRLDEIKLVNNSSLYLENSTNLVKKFTSGIINNGNFTKASVSINNTNGTRTSNVNNKLYIYEGRNVNIALNEKITAYGEVTGMTYFGMFTYDRDNNIMVGYFNPNYNNSSTVPTNDLTLFDKGSYVLGAHFTNHNYEVDGFWSDFPKKDAIDKVEVKYIVPTPDDADYYMWVVGEQVASFEIDLVASKYSTLGTYELPLLNFSAANTSFSVLGFNYNELEENVNLVDKSQIPKVASPRENADYNMALVMKSSETGWITKGATNFFSSSELSNGTVTYLSENSSTVPTFLFYLYHSKNLNTAGSMGSVTISMVAITPIDDLNSSVKRINIVANISRTIYDTDDYEGTFTTGKSYEMFAPGIVNITSNSSFSAYYSLFIESENNVYRTGYHRVLTSSYNLPVNTKITMIDFARGTRPEYYYYVVSQSDYNAKQIELQNNNEVTYNLSNFIKMGSSNSSNTYDDIASNSIYYKTAQHYTEEEFIFIVDFKEAGITTDVLNQSLLLEIRSDDNQIIYSVIDAEQQQLFYNLYANKASVIDLTANLSTTDIYVGHDVHLYVSTNFIEQYVNNEKVVDTNFHDYRTGIKLTIKDMDGNVVNGPSIMGLSYRLNGTVYYPRFDGTVRMNVAERIANVFSNITINTEGSNLASGNYKFLIESFGSPDGIYYGLVPSDSIEIPFTVKNTIYGLKVATTDDQLIVDKTTGINEGGTNAISFNFNYSSGLLNPNIRVSLYRRKYDDVYSSNYELVDIKDYISNDYGSTSISKVYTMFSNPEAVMSDVIYMKNNLTSGTYRIVFALYDNDTYIGDVCKYIIIK